MPRISSSNCSAPANVVAIAVFVGLAAIALRGERANACGGGESPGISELTTFDPKVLGDVDGPFYEPFEHGFGGACSECIAKAMSRDWNGYFKGAIPPADWDKVLLTANETELAAIASRLSGKSTPAPKGYESLFKTSTARDKLAGAVAFVQLARKIEPFATFETYDPDGKPRAPRAGPPDDLIAAARAGMKSKDPFLAQRYAFQALRVSFYRRDWPTAIALFDHNASVLGGPSADLAWRARHYLAGALARNGNKGRANLELARIHGNYPPLSGLAAQDFHPAEDLDWRQSLRLARTVREKTELWRLVGVTSDGVVAMQEIIKLDPKSNLIGLLLVRELARAEANASNPYEPPSDPTRAAARKKAYAALEQIATSQIAKAGDRPWLMELVAGHIAAKRGDLATARSRLARAVASRPGDARVASQAKASLAMALVANWKMTSQYEDELAIAMNSLDPAFERIGAVRSEVRHELAKAYFQAGKLVDAEFLVGGTVDGADAPGAHPKPKWHDVGFIKEMIARTTRTSTEFDRFVLADAIARPNLEKELAMRYLLDGDLASAAKLYQTAKPSSELLHTDPFAIHIRDCHDCDHETYGNSKWTHANLVAKLAELELKAKSGGEAGAAAALALGNAFYNMTWHGNARVVLESTHQETSDASQALRWYKRAFDLTKNRELEAKAAFLAAKAELGNLVGAPDPERQSGTLPIPKHWFPIVKTFSNTQYYKEVLKECGHFRDWVGASRAKP